MLENGGGSLEGRGKVCFLKLCGILWGIRVIGEDVITMVRGEIDMNIILIINGIVI